MIDSVRREPHVNGCEKPTLDGRIDQRYRMVQVC
jgi:hypothetical protein